MDEMKPTQGVMINVPDDIKRFIGTDNDPLLSDYSDTYVEIAHKVEKLAQIEEMVLQKRCMKNIKIKLSTLREYVYARTPFYRRGKSTNDIRIIVSRIDEIYPGKTPTLDELYKDQEFMDKAKSELLEAMLLEHVYVSEKYFGMSEVQKF